MEYLTLGKIVGVFGLKGDVKIYSSTDFGTLRYKKGNKVLLLNEEKNERYSFIVSSYRQEGNLDIIRFKNFEDIDLITPYLSHLVQIEKDASFLKKDTYLFNDLLGCAVMMSNDTLPFGIVKKIEEYASYRTLRVAREEKSDVLIPFVKAFIKEVDISKKLIHINFIEGLL